MNLRLPARFGGLHLFPTLTPLVLILLAGRTSSRWIYVVAVVFWLGGLVLARPKLKLLREPGVWLISMLTLGLNLMLVSVTLHQ